jgi:hypothetical protein
VSLPAIGALLRRHFIAVLAILIIAAGVDYSLKHAAPSFMETQTLVFVPPRSGAHPNPLSAIGGSLLQTAGVIAVQAMNHQEQQQVLRAGGTASYDVELINSYNLQYPNFSNAYLTVTTTATDPAAVHRTFVIINRLLTDQFTAQQVRDNVAPNNRITIIQTGDTGPLIEQGSPKRVLIGLIILTLVAIFGVAMFLERHPVRIGPFGRRAPAGRPAPPGRPDWARPDRAGQPVAD